MDKPFLQQLTVHVDDRGYLAEIFRCDDPAFKEFGQVYIVGDFAKGTVRAFHRHFWTWDYFFVSHGAGKFVLVDPIELNILRGNESYQIYTLSSKKFSILHVPPLWWHGWMALEDDTQLISITNKPYDRSSPDEERAHPERFTPKDGITFWEVKGR